MESLANRAAALSLSMRTGERAFTVVEATIGAAIAFFAIWLLVALASRYAGWAAGLNDTLNAQNAAARICERLSSEAASAWAVFVPPSDVTGADNSDGHELDFFTQDGSHRAYAWAYRFDPVTKMITRYSYAPGANAQPGETLGPFDGFRATLSAAPAIALPTSAIYDPLFASATVTPVSYSFQAMPAAIGGNGLVHVTLLARGVNQDVVLASGTAPTTFTVVLTYTPPPPQASTTPPVLPTLTPTP